MTKSNTGKLKTVIGVITLILILTIICIWAYWGVNETFHEGWYYKSFLRNLLLTFVQYLSTPTILIVTSIMAINFKRVGSLLFFFFGIFALFFFNSNAGRLLIFLPTILVALGFYFGNFTHKKTILFTFTTLPLIVILIFGIPQIIRVENRLNDGDFGPRTISGNEVELTWAPQGVGFPLEGTNWLTATNNCKYLNKEGAKLENVEVNIWRLPTREELVRSLTRRNNNVKGFIDNTGTAQYYVKPDKETPLWDPHSKVIYYWTSESASSTHAYSVAYNGTILSRSKDSGANYQGYRCVKQP